MRSVTKHGTAAEVASSCCPKIKVLVKNATLTICHSEYQNYHIRKSITYNKYTYYQYKYTGSIVV